MCAALFDRAAGRLQQQHERVEAYRRDVRQALRRDPFAESREREAMARDKYKPQDAPPTLPNQLPPAAAAGAVPGALPGAAPGINPLGNPPALGMGGIGGLGTTTLGAEVDAPPSLLLLVVLLLLLLLPPRRRDVGAAWAASAVPAFWVPF